MQIDTIITTLSIIGFTSTVFYAMFRVSKFAFLLNLVILLAVVFFFSQGNQMVSIELYLVCPLILINTGLDLLYLTGHRVKSVLVIKINFEKCQEKKEITLQSLRKKL